MQDNFWKKIAPRGTRKQPIMAIAPMSGVTDQAFRLMFSKYGKPDVFWTEFVPVAGFLSKGKAHCLKVLKFFPAERPIVAQVFGADPLEFEKAAAIIADLGFDGIDINMGCPDKDVEKKGGGAALIKNPNLAKEIIRATKRGAGKIPVSVKTRIGYDKNQISEWIPALFSEDLAALTVHFRTRNELYGVPAKWELAKEVVKLRDRIAKNTLILGNGDVKSFLDAQKLAKTTRLDGIMIGRGVLGNPWFFSKHEPSVLERLNAIVEHAEIFEKLNDGKQFETLKKHFHAYAKGFNGARDLRDSLMKVNNARETKKIIADFLSKW